MKNLRVNVKKILVCISLFILLMLSVQSAGVAQLKLEDYPISGLGLKVTTSLKANEPYSLACIVKNSTNPYMIAQLKGFENAGKAMGFKAITMAPAKQNNMEEFIRIMEDLIQRGVKGFAVHPPDSEGVVSIVEKAYAMGIPTISINTTANTDKVLKKVGLDFVQGGFEMGSYICKKLNGKGNIIILEGPPQALNAVERNTGIYKALEKYPEIVVLASQPADFDRLKGMQVMENLLQRFQKIKIDAIITANDEEAMGAIAALEASGRDKEGIIISGFDANKDACYAIKEGRMDVTYNCDPMATGWAAAAFLVMYFNGDPLPAQEFIPYPTIGHETFITKDNVDEYIEKLAWWK